MSHHKPRFRWLGTRLPASSKRRLVVLTGARQTGKTTLAQQTWPKLGYCNLDDSQERETLKAISAPGWHKAIGSVILDEAQKLPEVFEKVKYAYDAGDLDFSVLLGSSQILLLEQVRESLAGRAFLYELWPLMSSEIRHSQELLPARPLIDEVLCSTEGLGSILADQPEVLRGEEYNSRKDALAWLGEWGGMPELLRLDAPYRREWLRSYQRTYLERDISDLARLSDLEPFKKLQHLAMLRSGELLSYSKLARDTGIAPGTARNYLEYLRLSYQVILLPSWQKTLTSSTIKSPKVYWVDLGLLRSATRQLGDLTGPLFETLVVGEVHKWCSTMAVDVSLYFYRTRSGLEVDLLVQTAHGIIGMEIKNRQRTSRSDFTPLRKIATSLGETWLGGMVIYGGDKLSRIDEALDLWQVPAHHLF